MSTNFGLNLGAVYVANKDLTTDAVPVFFDRDEELKVNVTNTTSNKIPVSLSDTVTVNVNNSVNQSIPVNLTNQSIPVTGNVSISNAAVPITNESINGTKTALLVQLNNTAALPPSSTISGTPIGQDSSAEAQKISVVIPPQGTSGNKVYAVATQQFSVYKTGNLLGTNSAAGTAVPSSTPPPFTTSTPSTISLINEDGVKYNRINLMGELSNFASSGSNVYSPNGSTAVSAIWGTSLQPNAGDGLPAGGTTTVVVPTAKIYIWYSVDGVKWFLSRLGSIDFTGTAAVAGTGSTGAMNPPIQFSRDWETAAKYVGFTFDSAFSGIIMYSLSQ